MAGGKKGKEKPVKHNLFCILDVCVVGIRNQTL